MAKGITALVIDRGQSSRKAIIKGLRDHLNAETVLEAVSAQEAISQCRQIKQLDCVLIDLEMPNCNGLELIAEIKKLSCAAQASFIALSTSRDKNDLLRAAAAGVHDYIVKPFNAGTLATKLSKLANSPKFRRSERMSLLETFRAKIRFGDTNQAIYQARLIDLSIGGCRLRTELFNRGGGCIYDQAVLEIQTHRQPVRIEAILLLTERDLESTDQSTMLASFQFLEKDPDSIEQISRFIDHTKQQGASGKGGLHGIS